MSKIDNNKLFLESIFGGGDFERHGFIARSQGDTIAIDGEDYTMTSKPMDVFVDRYIRNYERDLAFFESVGSDHVPCASHHTATHIFAAAFGCAVHRYEDDLPCALPMVETAAEADSLEVPDMWATPYLSRIFDFTSELEKRLGRDVPIMPGDMQSAFDIAAQIWNKESLLVAMLDDEQKGAVKRLIAKCNRLLIGFTQELRRAFPQLQGCHCPSIYCPGEFGPWVSHDECGMISPGMFEEFCLPELREFSEAFGGIGIHCCADAEHQFGLFKEIPNFYGFNRVAAKRGYDPLLDYFDGPGSPVHVLAWIDDATIERLVRRAGAGTRFIFVRSFTDTEEGKAWYGRMRELAG